jgi:hypothetical protein
MTSLPDEPSDKEAKAKEKQAQAETKAQAGREATADYRAREAAADDNAHRLKGLRLARDAEAADQAANARAPVAKARRARKATRPDEGLRPDQLTTESDG